MTGSHAYAGDHMLSRGHGPPGFLASAVRYWWLVALLVILGGVGGYFAAMSQTIRYEATAELLLTDPRNVGVFREMRAQFSDPGRYLRNQAQRMETSLVATEAAGLLDGRYDPQDIRRRIRTEPAPDLDMISVRAVDATRQGAADLANAVAQAYQNVVTREVRAQADEAIAELEQTTGDLRARVVGLDGRLTAEPDNAAVRAERDAALGQLVQLEGRADQIAVDAALYGSGVEAFETAQLPERPVQPRPAEGSALGAVAGLLAGVGLAWGLANRSRRAMHAQDPARILGAPLLGEIPEFKTVGATGLVPAALRGPSAAAEAYEFVMASLLHALEQVKGKTALVTSALPGEGKTLTVLNLAALGVRDGQPILAVDADIRARGLTRHCAVEDNTGLSSLGNEAVPFEWAVTHCKVAEDVYVPVVPSGPSDLVHRGFFRGPELRTAMARLRGHDRPTLIDSPPLLAVPDTSALASHTDGTVLVVVRGTSLETIEAVRERLEFVGAPLLGYVFNRADPRSSRGAYGYGYGYGYGEDAKAAGRRRWTLRQRALERVG